MIMQISDDDAYQFDSPENPDPYEYSSNIDWLNLPIILNSKEIGR